MLHFNEIMFSNPKRHLLGQLHGDQVVVVRLHRVRSLHVPLSPDHLPNSQRQRHRRLQGHQVSSGLSGRGANLIKLLGAYLGA